MFTQTIIKSNISTIDYSIASLQDSQEESKEMSQLSMMERMIILMSKLLITRIKGKKWSTYLSYHKRIIWSQH